MVVGHYLMVAGVLNSLGVPLEDGVDGFDGIDGIEIDGLTRIEDAP